LGTIGGPFTLTGTDGQPFASSRLNGRPAALFFGFTHCPDVCPTTLATFRQVHELLGEAAANVRFLFVTVDPRRDDVARMAEYVTRFHPEFLGLTGDLSAMEQVWAEYGIYVNALPADPQRGGAYEVEHSALTFLIDRDGMMRIVHNHGTPAEDIVHDIRLLLSERG
ncbi:MAG TPA: SCO family protein, partial [Bacillota bacterium]